MLGTPDPMLLSAWLDGELEPEQRAQIETWLREHPEEAARVRLWAADRDALRARFDPALDEPVPPALRRQVLGEAPRREQRAWQAAAAMALLVLGGAVGAAVGWQMKGRSAAALAQSGWPQRAALAHAVYVPEQRHPVEVNVAEGGAAQEEHLQRWLAKRLQMPVKLFDLRAQGFDLVGGRLLPDAPSPGAQLMYQRRGDGLRVTVYLRKPEQGTPAAFRYERDGAVGVFYWVEGGAGYALAGELPREQLLSLAQAIYQQGGDAQIREGAGGPRP